MSNTFRFDTHVHTDETSHCGKVPGEEMVRLYAEAGYSGFVMTDHYNRYSMQVHGCQTPEEEVETFLKGYRAAKAKGDEIGFDVLPGMELQPDGAYNEYLLYGLTEEFLYAHPHIYEEDLLTLRRLATENDILIFQAHPYRPGLTRAMPGFLDGVEVFNGNPPPQFSEPAGIDVRHSAQAFAVRWLRCPSDGGYRQRRASHQGADHGSCYAEAYSAGGLRRADPQRIKTKKGI